MDEVNHLLAEAKSGTLNAQEVLYVAKKIQAFQFENDEQLCKLLLILGLSGATEYRELVESFLNGPNESVVPGIAFRVLFRYWEDPHPVTDSVFKRMKNLMVELPFDQYEYVLLDPLQLTPRPLYSVEDLIMEAKYGTLMPEEVSHVADTIKKAQVGDGTDLYALLFILGVSLATDHRELVEEFLHYPADPMVSGMALKVLVQYWEKGANRYLNAIKTLLQGAHWDPLRDARLAALQCVGGFLRNNPEKDLIERLLDLYQAAGSNDEASKEVIFEALATAVGKDLDAIIAFKKSVSEGSLSDQPFLLDVLKQAKHLIKKLESCSSQ